MAMSTQAKRVHPDVKRLFMPPWPEAPADCARCQKRAKVRSLAKGPLAGTVITDMNVLIRRHAARGHM
ncbi:hypothetical protein ACFYYS_06090 [Streptomyces sp. NPDC002120]|uniref:hypothetical protein n=1 Tax=Streptomyces sp. NPDC002120 TaxID=3364631 RepID=UPI0036CD32EE